MKIEPVYASIGELFAYKPMFFIPKYQRAYAWDSESIADFIKDLTDCFEKRKSGSPINHFFGGILSVKHSVQGAVNQHSYEIIDGQQRLATFTLLVSCLIGKYETLKREAERLGDRENTPILQGRIDKLSERFDDLQIIEYLIENDFTIIHMVTSSRDDAYRLFQVINDRGTSLTVV